MSDQSTALQAIFNRIEAGNRLSQRDLQMLVAAVRSQQMTIATGDRAVAIGGSADGAVIVTGDRNVVITGANVEAILALQGRRPRSEKLLIQEVQNEVAARLKQSLHNQVFIHLEMQQGSEQVKRPWDSEIKIGDQPTESLSETTDILQVFDRADVAGKLLILGAPGVGKTTTLLELAKEICERANEDSEFPIPVLVNLSSWKGASQLISDWLVGELKLKYGVKNEIGRKWVENSQLLPLLDGLDELDSSLHIPCVHALNQFINSTYRPSGIVVCSRQDEYSNFKTKLQLNGAVSLQALNTKQIQEYLSFISRQDIWNFIQTDPNLTELVRTPLFLSILVLIYKQISIGELKSLSSRKESIKYLLNVYITRMLMRNSINNLELKNRIYSQRKSENWLIWLAQEMQFRSRFEFLIEDIQPDLVALTAAQDKILSARVALILVCLLILAGIFSGKIFSLGGIFIFGLIVISILSFYGLIFSLLEDKIIIGENYKWEWKNLNIQIVTLSLIVLFVLIILNSLNIGGASIPTVGILFPILLNQLRHCLVIVSVDTKLIPNQGIWRSLKNSFDILLIFILSFGISGATFWYFGLDLIGAIIGIAGCFLGVAFGFKIGGEACIRHFFLRLILSLKGYTPWNYARFLNYATDRLLLQRVGGRYRFIHRLLQEHFAAMSLEQVKGDR